MQPVAFGPKRALSEPRSQNWIYKDAPCCPGAATLATQMTPPCRQAARKNATLPLTCGAISARSSLSCSPNNARIARGNTTKSWKNRVVVFTRVGANAGNVPSSSDWAASARSRATACVAVARHAIDAAGQVGKPRRLRNRHPHQTDCVTDQHPLQDGGGDALEAIFDRGAGRS